MLYTAKLFLSCAKKFAGGKITTKKARIAVIGLGYVGLPLAVNFAKAGFKVFGLDMDVDRVALVNKRKSYILDIPTKDVAQVVRARAKAD